MRSDKIAQFRFQSIPSAHPSRQLAHPLFHGRKDCAAAHQFPHGVDVGGKEAVGVEVGDGAADGLVGCKGALAGFQVGEEV